MFKKDKIAADARLFENIGGEFVTPATILSEKLKNTKGFIFDWDGVFNDGYKGINATSDFAEPDAMALHILRYAYWKLHHELPIIAIITGQNNESAFKLAEREHLGLVLAGYRDKFEALEIFRLETGLQKHQTASMFDDIIDYPLAVSTEARFLVRRNGSPMFHQYVKENHLCDYITGNQSSFYPVREVAELIIGLWGNYDEMIISRFRDKDAYETFWQIRQAVQTKIFRK